MSLFDGLTNAGTALGAGSLWAPIGMTAGALTNLANSYINYRNYQLQKDQFNYQRNIQQNIFQREDNSIQRRTQDLIAAGLSPVLAAGSGASAGNVVSTKAPQLEQFQNPVTDVMNVMALLKMKQDISMSEAQVDLIKAQAEKTNVESDTNKWNLDFYKESGQPTNSSGLVKDIIQGLGAVKSNQVKNAENAIKSKLPMSENPNHIDKGGFWQKLDWFLTPQGEKNKLKGR